MGRGCGGLGVGVGLGGFGIGFGGLGRGCPVIDELDVDEDEPNFG